MIEYHSCEQQNIFNGIGDLEEKFGGGITSMNKFQTGNKMELVTYPFVRGYSQRKKHSLIIPGTKTNLRTLKTR